MTAAAWSAVGVGVLLIAGLVVLAVAVRRRGAVVSAVQATGDPVTSDVVSGLMAELRRQQAETEYWKEAATRLQRELDAQTDPPEESSPRGNRPTQTP